MDIDLQSRGIAKVTRKLDGIATRSTHAEPAFRRIAGRIARSNELGWSGLQRNATSTIAAKRSGEPLVRTGALKADLTNARRGTLVLMGDKLVFGSRRSYARFSLGTKHEPRRQPMKVTPRMRQESVEIVADGIMRPKP